MSTGKINAIKKVPAPKTQGRKGLVTNLFGAYSNAVLQRLSIANMVGRLFNGRRDLYEVFGYSRMILYREAWQRYRRQDICSRIIEAPAKALWANPPHVSSTSQAWNDTWNDIVISHNLWDTITRVDKMAGLGDYAILLVGFDDAAPVSLMDPITPRKGRKVIYLQPYDYATANITKLVTNPSDPRYLKPDLYRVMPLLEERPKPVGGWAITPFQVHNSRIVHVAENLMTDTIFGNPRVERVWNLLDDLLKVTGGSAEMFWLAANRGMQIDVDKEMELTPEDEADLTAEVEDYIHQMSRVIRTRGVKVNNLGSDTPDPTGVFTMLVKMLSGATGIPAQILVGSETGQLASDQDRNNWAERIKERRKDFGEPNVLWPLIRILTQAGVLPNPDGLKITISWPDAFHLTPLERAQTSAQKARSAANISKALLQTPKLLSPEQISSILDFDIPDQVEVTNDLLESTGTQPD